MKFLYFSNLAVTTHVQMPTSPLFVFNYTPTAEIYALSLHNDIPILVVTINPKPTVVITNPAAVCSPATVDLTAAAVTAEYTVELTFPYYPDAPLPIVIANPNAVAASGTYYITATTADPATFSHIQPV